jgi:putative sugar O-methyltransferase
MKEFEFSSGFVQRYRDFLSSDCYRNVSPHSKSDYWNHYADVINVDISGNKITVGAESGFYVPREKDLSKYLINRIFRLIKDPSLLIPFINRMLPISEQEIKLLGYLDAFEKVMNVNPIVEPVLSPYRINFKKLRETPGVASSIEDIQKRYFAGETYKVDGHIVQAYYTLNILLGYVDITATKAILEIGGGNGNLLSILHKSTNNSTLIDVDLPETLSHAMLYIHDLFPKARILMPHEINSYSLDNYDFIFLTPEQIHVIEDRSIDLAINIDSFQEMTHKQIEEYFQLIQRTVKNDSYFYTHNRVEKIPSGPDACEKETSESPNRFSEYPWNPVNKTLIYEICKLTRLVQIDAAYMRLEQIKHT